MGTSASGGLMVIIVSAFRAASGKALTPRLTNSSCLKPLLSCRSWLEKTKGSSEW